MSVALGDKVRDRVTNVVGIAIARTEWLHGCIRIVIQPQETKDGKPVESFSVDEPSCEVIESGVVPNDPFWRDQRLPVAPTTLAAIEEVQRERRRTAGPQPEVSRQPDPQR